MVLPFILIGVGVAAFGARAVVRHAKTLDWTPLKSRLGASTDKFNNLKSKFTIMRVDQSGFESPMSTKEAYQILNVLPTTPKDEVRQAHRMLMLKNHPDNGGSNYIASKINEAKTILMPK